MYKKTPKTNISKARATAFAVLLKLDQGHAPGLVELLTESLKKAPLEDRDFSLAREIIFGTVRNYLGLEWILHQCMERPLDEKHDKIELIMIIGLFQLLFLERVPDHAIVDETVIMTRNQADGEKFTRVANAILRRVIREREEWLEKLAANPFDIRFSVPRFNMDLLAPVIGNRDQQEDFWAACQEQAPHCIRLRTISADEFDVSVAQPLELEFKKSEHLNDCLIVGSQNLPLLFQHHGFGEGWWTVEDEGAQLVANLVAPDFRDYVRELSDEDDHEIKPYWILDSCAAPGGKCAHMADLAENAYILALDVSRKKLERLNENMNRLNLSKRVNTLEGKKFWEVLDDPDPDKKIKDEDGLGFLLEKITDKPLSEQKEMFNAIVVDAPCSGFGTLRRHPEIRYRRSIEDVIKLQGVQLKILENAARVLKPGGTLSYIVCTITEQETIDVVRQFSKAHPEFSPANETPEVNSKAGKSIMKIDESMRCKVSGGWRLMPHLQNCDGFFAFRWIKGDDAEIAEKRKSLKRLEVHEETAMPEVSNETESIIEENKSE